MRIENRLDLDSRQNNLVVVSELLVLVCAASRARAESKQRDASAPRTSHARVRARRGTRPAHDTARVVTCERLRVQFPGFEG